MKIVRFASNGRVRYGVLEDGHIRGLSSSPFSGRARLRQLPAFDDRIYDVDEVRLLPPCRPSKIVCLGLNYRSHAEETNLPIPSVPLIFLKPSTAVIGPGETIVLPRMSKRVDYEGELAVVIGRRAKTVPVDKAGDYILGYTCLNDVSERYNQRDDGQWTRAKGYDTFAPLGPCIETETSPGDLGIQTSLNGEVRQSARTNDLIFRVPEIVSFITGVMTLLPGDVIATGTPSGIGRIEPGDSVEVTIESIGTLKNRVVRE